MRIILLLVAVAGLLFLAKGCLTNDPAHNGIVGAALGKVQHGGGDLLTKALKVPGVEPAAAPAGNTGAGAESGSSDATVKEDPNALGKVGAKAEELGKGEPEKAFAVYRFENREPPVAAEILLASGLDCTVTVDKVSGMAFVTGGVKAVEMVKSYLKEMDIAPGSCAVQSWAVYVDKTAERGFDLVQAIRSTVPTETAIVLGNGGLTLDIGGDEIATALRAICDGSVVEVVQRPHVQLMHAIPAKIESLQEVPVPSTAVSQGIAQTSVEYRKVGLQLSVTPFFHPRNQLTLAVVQSNGLIGQNVKIGENEVPVIESQSVATSVRMTVGQTVILGGVATLRERTVRGLLRSGKERSEGSLYVILSTYYDAPRAVPVGASPPQGSDVAPPLGPEMEDPREWIDSQLLPELPTTGSVKKPLGHPAK